MRVIIIKYIHRNHNGWEFRAAQARVEDEYKEKEVVFGVSKENGITRTGLEIYQGGNYIVGSNEPSRSWRYEAGNIPKKWQRLYDQLEAMHGIVDWSGDVSKITSTIINTK
jgi:hypothetical protein